jgi:hypothetical protein
VARRRRASRAPRGLALACVVSLLALALPGLARATTYPPLPIEDGRDLVGNLSAPTLAPGASGAIGFTVHDPLPDPLTAGELTLAVYAFNAFPGNATSFVPVAGAPVLSAAGASGAAVNVSLPSLSPGATYRGSVGVTTASSTPSGTFAVRTALTFRLASNATTYLLESRGWFTASAWAAATEEPNGSATLNLSRLGVSGVTPETAVLVAASDWDWVLGSLLAAAIVLAGVAAWIYFKRGPGSTSGTR